MPKIKLRQWQREAISKALTWLTEGKQDKRFLINAAPGAGKTICASVLAKHLLELGEVERVIVIAPRLEVVRQWAEEFKLVTGRHMSKVTGSDSEIEDYGSDLCATWAAIQGLLDGFQQVCSANKTLLICDEHHHAAVEAAWGIGAEGAFSDARYSIILSGTPIRSDGKEPVWFAYDSEGSIDHPDDGTYTLTYGQAVDLNYCRPITFHRHEGHFSVKLADGDDIAVSSTGNSALSKELKRVRGLQEALDFYKLACTPKYLAGNTTPDIKSYQGSMLEWGISKLDDLRNSVPNAGGLVIAPNIKVAEYMSALLEEMDAEKPILVHSDMANAQERIAAFKNTKKKWLVSVAMISEGVDIKRLRVLVYLPYAKTELAFRQAMGRVVRTLGPEDISRAYVVMPSLQIFKDYARRVEQEMSPSAREESPIPTTKTCPVCETINPKSAKNCKECGHEFSTPKPNYKTCDACGSLNPMGAETCQNCGKPFSHDFEITLEQALRDGAIVRGMDIEEEDVRTGENIAQRFKKDILSSGDEALIKLLPKLPEESLGRLKKILN